MGAYNFRKIKDKKYLTNQNSSGIIAKNLKTSRTLRSRRICRIYAANTENPIGYFCVRARNAAVFSFKNRREE